MITYQQARKPLKASIPLYSSKNGTEISMKINRLFLNMYFLRGRNINMTLEYLHMVRKAHSWFNDYQTLKKGKKYLFKFKKHHVKS